MTDSAIALTLRTAGIEHDAAWWIMPCRDALLAALVS